MLQGLKLLDPFQVNVPILYPPRKHQKPKLFQVISGAKVGTLVRNGIKKKGIQSCFQEVPLELK